MGGLDRPGPSSPYKTGQETKQAPPSSGPTNPRTRQTAPPKPSVMKMRQTTPPATPPNPKRPDVRQTPPRPHLKSSKKKVVCPAGNKCDCGSGWDCPTCGRC